MKTEAPAPVPEGPSPADLAHALERGLAGGYPGDPAAGFPATDAAGIEPPPAVLPGTDRTAETAPVRAPEMTPSNVVIHASDLPAGEWPSGEAMPAAPDFPEVSGGPDSIPPAGTAPLPAPNNVVIHASDLPPGAWPADNATTHASDLPPGEWPGAQAVPPAPDFTGAEGASPAADSGPVTADGAAAGEVSLSGDDFSPEGELAQGPPQRPDIRSPAEAASQKHQGPGGMLLGILSGIEELLRLSQHKGLGPIPMGGGSSFSQLSWPWGGDSHGDTLEDAEDYPASAPAFGVTTLNGVRGAGGWGLGSGFGKNTLVDRLEPSERRSDRS